jgi:hypothetical protein
MTFDNSFTIKIQRLTLFAASVILLAYFVLTYFERIIKYPLLGMSDAIWTIMLVLVYLIIVLMPWIRKFQFVYYSDEGESIIFRYFESGIFGGRKNSVEIDKKTFSGFKTESQVLGLIRIITLYQQFKEGIAKYPPVYISALSKRDRNKVIKSLKQFGPQL